MKKKLRESITDLDRANYQQHLTAGFICWLFKGQLITYEQWYSSF